MLGAKSGQHIEIKEGVELGEQVVTQGNYQLKYISVGGVHTHDHGPGEDHHDHENHEDAHADHGHDDHEGHDHHDHHNDGAE